MGFPPFWTFFRGELFHFCRWFEQQQTAAGVKRVKDWAGAKISRLEDSDIFISGNADEVESSILTSCQWSIGHITSGYLVVISPGSQPIFRAQPRALSALQQYDDRSALDADGRRNSSFSKRLERERSASLLPHALHLYLGPDSQWKAERGATFPRE